MLVELGHRLSLAKLETKSKERKIADIVYRLVKKIMLKIIAEKTKLSGEFVR